MPSRLFRWTALAGDLLQVLVSLPSVEILRRRLSLHEATSRVREKGRRADRRSPDRRLYLRRIIQGVDCRLPGGSNCVRRSLIEIRLDAGAADERLFAGFKSGGGVASGHAWLESDPTVVEFDAVVTV